MNNYDVKKISRIPASSFKGTKPPYVKPVMRLFSSSATFIIIKYHSFISEYSCCILANGAGPAFFDYRCSTGNYRARISWVLCD